MKHASGLGMGLGPLPLVRDLVEFGDEVGHVHALAGLAQRHQGSEELREEAGW